MSYKKWIHKYKFLQEDLIDVSNQWDIYYENFCEDFNLDVEENKEPTEIKVEKLPNRISDNLCKPIFKKLSKTLHPDKGGNNEDFVRISNYYRNQDIIGLYIISEKYNIDIDDLIIDDVLHLFELSCEKIEDQIMKKQNTIAWEWSTANKIQKIKTAKYLKDKFNISLKNSSNT